MVDGLTDFGVDAVELTEKIDVIFLDSKRSFYADTTPLTVLTYVLISVVCPN